MNLITASLQKPITVVVFVMALLFLSVLSIRKIPIDIFPNLDIPAIYISQPYGGLSPDQMEGFITSNLEYYCIYLTGLESVESKSVQNYALIKLQFHPGTDMNQAMSEVVANVNRAKSKMPEGTVPPFIVRLDAGSIPVGQLVFKSETLSLTEIQDQALFKVRPMFSSIEGVSAPPPFGGNQKAVIIQLNPDKIRSLNISPEDIIETISQSNSIIPAGNIRIGDKNYITPINSVLPNIKDFENIPVRTSEGVTLLIRDIASVVNGSDITTGYALINGKRSVYIPVSKRSDASTISVVKNVKAALPAMQAAVPEGITVSYEFDQSSYVTNSLNSLVTEALIGALLTGLIVLLFLGDIRSALIVIITIPVALLGGVVGLALAGQTINLMTLGGLALSVGILVDEATVTIENIHRHQEMNKSSLRAILDASLEISLPKLLILFSIIIVFVPSFFMTGLPKAMFIPLSLAVGFSMIVSFLLSQTLVPVLAAWLLKSKSGHKKTYFDNVKARYLRFIQNIQPFSGILQLVYLIVLVFMSFLLFKNMGTEIFPRADGGQMQLRLKMPPGTKFEKTEAATKLLLERIDSLAGKENIEITSCFVGAQPSSFPNNTIYLWTSGQHEAVIQIKLRQHSGVSLESLREKIRQNMPENNPGLTISFEPADLVDRVMSLGSNTQLEVAVLGKDLKEGKKYADFISAKMTDINYLRDIQIPIALKTPALKIDIDRERAAQFGLSMADVGKAVLAATSSSRFLKPVYWLDQKSGNAYQVQIEMPQNQLKSLEQLEGIPVGNQVYLRDVASVYPADVAGEYVRYNQQRMINITANMEHMDLGNAVKDIRSIIQKLGELPKGMSILIKGQGKVLTDTLNELQSGLIIALLVIFLLIAANFQSFKISFAVLLIVISVITGALLLLWMTNNTLNIQSFMGIIMAIGVAVSNSILLLNAAENERKSGMDRKEAAISAADSRMRPILMTAIAMIAGMMPMAIGINEAGDQVAPLGIAVIGGLLFSTFSTLFILPSLYILLVKKEYQQHSLLPNEYE